jgi:hypothetical protein
VKILFVGQLAYGQTSRMRLEALQSLGHEVVGLDVSRLWAGVPWLARQVQQRANRGPTIAALNKAIVACARRERPDLFWGEKLETLDPDAVVALRRLGIRSLHYTPDPYFSVSWKRTRLLDACMPLFEYAVTSKTYELDDYRRVCQQVFYMPLGFCESVHRPLAPADAATRRHFQGDVSFVGGWEPRREALLDRIARTGCRLNIWGYAWEHVRDGRWTPRRFARLRQLAGHEAFAIRANPGLAAALRGGEVFGDRYAWALAATHPGRFVAVGAPVATARDVVVSGTFRKLSGPDGGGYGLLLRVQSPTLQDGVNQGGQYYVFEVGDRGEVGVWLRSEDHWVDLLTWTPSAIVRPGAMSNELTVRATRDQFTFVVNDIEVARVVDATLADGGIGLFAGGDLNEVLVKQLMVLEP